MSIRVEANATGAARWVINTSGLFMLQRNVTSLADDSDILETLSGRGTDSFGNPVYLDAVVGGLERGKVMHVPQHVRQRTMVYNSARSGVAVTCVTR
jgi:hypothetical protein